MADQGISKMINGLPPPFNTFGDIIWNGLEKQDDSDQDKMLEIFEKIASNNEVKFMQISASIKKLFENNASNEDLQDLGKEIITSNKEVAKILGHKVDELLVASKRVDSTTQQTLVETQHIRKVVDQLNTLPYPAYSDVEFYVVLSSYLDESFRTFRLQREVTNQLHDLLQKRFDVGRLEYAEMFKKFHRDMNTVERENFNILQQMTADIADTNDKMLEHLNTNRNVWQTEQEPINLHEHLKFWKQLYNAQKDDPDMCLVYAKKGNVQKPFPSGIHKFVLMKLQMKLQYQLRHTSSILEVREGGRRYFVDYKVTGGALKSLAHEEHSFADDSLDIEIIAEEDGYITLTIPYALLNPYTASGLQKHLRVEYPTDSIIVGQKTLPQHKIEITIGFKKGTRGIKLLMTM